MASIGHRRAACPGARAGVAGRDCRVCSRGPPGTVGDRRGSSRPSCGVCRSPRSSTLWPAGSPSQRAVGAYSRAYMPRSPRRAADRGPASAEDGGRGPLARWTAARRGRALAPKPEPRAPCPGGTPAVHRRYMSAVPFPVSCARRPVLARARVRAGAARRTAPTTDCPLPTARRPLESGAGHAGRARRVATPGASQGPQRAARGAGCAAGRGALQCQRGRGGAGGASRPSFVAGRRVRPHSPVLWRADAVQHAAAQRCSGAAPALERSSRPDSDAQRRPSRASRVSSPRVGDCDTPPRRRTPPHPAAPRRACPRGGPGRPLAIRRRARSGSGRSRTASPVSPAIPASPGARRDWERRQRAVRVVWPRGLAASFELPVPLLASWTPGRGGAAPAPQRVPPPATRYPALGTWAPGAWPGSALPARMRGARCALVGSGQCTMSVIGRRPRATGRYARGARGSTDRVLVYAHLFHGDLPRSRVARRAPGDKLETRRRQGRGFARRARGHARMPARPPARPLELGSGTASAASAAGADHALVVSTPPAPPASGATDGRRRPR